MVMWKIYGMMFLCQSMNAPICSHIYQLPLITICVISEMYLRDNPSKDSLHGFILSLRWIWFYGADMKSD
jgi:hypothetical protein